MHRQSLPPDYDPVEWEFFNPPRVTGAGRGALRAAWRAWWDNWFELLVVNAVWMLSFFFAPAFPAVTATLFYQAGQAVNGDPIGWHTFWYPLRRYFWPALGWGLVNGGMALVTAALARPLAGAGAVGTLAWGLWWLVLGAWGAINLFFWPLWFRQPPPVRTVRGTWRASARWIRHAPVAAALVVGVSLLLILVAFRTIPLLFLFTIFMAAPALLATAVVAAHPLPD